MKTIARIYKWIILSVLLQALILLFFNNYYLDRGGAVKVTSIETDGKPKEDVGVKMPSGASSIKVSYDASFAAYIIDGRIEIFDIQKKKVKAAVKPEGDAINYIKWLPDRNMVIYSETTLGEQNGSVKITTWDVDSDMKRSLPPISKLAKQCEVVDIQLSALTNVVYVKIKTSETTASIYKYNIMDTLSFVMSTAPNTVIKEATYSDKLIYQDGKNKVYVNDSIKGRTWQIPYKNKAVLLGLDTEDKAYVGELNKENKVYTIHYGKLASESVKSWNQISLDRAVLPENLIITPDDEIYEVRSEENCVYDVQDDKKIEFKGKFIEIIKGYIVSQNGSELKLKAIK